MPKNKGKSKPGPEPQRLKIDDPETALGKLLSTPPPPKSGGEEGESTSDSDVDSPADD